MYGFCVRVASNRSFCNKITRIRLSIHHNFSIYVAKVGRNKEKGSIERKLQLFPERKMPPEWRLWSPQRRILKQQDISDFRHRAIMDIISNTEESKLRCESFVCTDMCRKNNERTFTYSSSCSCNCGVRRGWH
jgi:hypothetical protein